MQFENCAPDEGINAQPENLGREAIWLIFGAIGCVILLVVLADVGARWLAPRLPFSVEQALAERMEGQPPKLPAAEQAANAALQGLADRLRGPLGMPDDITVHVRVDDSEVLNAYASVGGRIVIHRGLLRRLQGEHELAALLAHEMAHVQHRHVAASLGRAMAIGLVLTVVSADAGGQAAGVLLEQTGGLLMRGYGRDHEREADTGAMRAAAALHGHVGGVIGLFDRIAVARDEQPQRDDGQNSGEPGRKRCATSADPTDPADPSPKPSRNVPTWLSTHPADEDRTEAARTWARENGVPLSGATPAIHPALLAWVQASQGPCKQAERPGQLAQP
ncbi:MAG: M48 family metallopeptidase [Gammaproteobacteria bacterium]|nr:M48 family metallopeptidase [Gammaproteobacteria bacterium]